MYLHLCDAGPNSGRDPALSGGLGPTVLRPETCWAHFTSPNTPEQRRQRGGRKRVIDGEKEKYSCLPSTSVFPDSCGYLSPLCPSHPPILGSFLTLACLFTGIPALCVRVSYLPLSPSFSFSPTLRGGQEVEERMDGEKVRWLG